MQSSPEAPWIGPLALAALSLAACASTADGDAPLRGRVAFDHVVLLAPDSGLGDALAEHFTEATALETRHAGQGTRGRYFLFLDAFVEVLELVDADEARANAESFGSDYVRRFTPGGGSPFAVGLVALGEEPFDLPYDVHEYRAEGAPEPYLMARGNRELAVPFIYAAGSERAYPRRESIDEVDSIEDPEIREAVRSYLSHPSGATRLVGIEFRVPEEARDCANALLLERLSGTDVIVGGPAIELVFECEGLDGAGSFVSPAPHVRLRWVAPSAVDPGGR